MTRKLIKLGQNKKYFLAPLKPTPQADALWVGPIFEEEKTCSAGTSSGHAPSNPPFWYLHQSARSSISKAEFNSKPVVGSITFLKVGPGAPMRSSSKNKSSLVYFSQFYILENWRKSIPAHLSGWTILTPGTWNLNIQSDLEAVYSWWFTIGDGRHSYHQGITWSFHRDPDHEKPGWAE